MSDALAWVDGALAELEGEGLLRSLQAVGPVEPIDAVHVKVGGERLALFSSNDYLGLSAHPDVRRAASEACDRFGMGPRGSPLICGYTEQHEALEAELAALFGTEAALLFPTGYAANLAALSALSADTTIFSDELNHASMIDGCRLAKQDGARTVVYRHCDLSDLESKLRATSGRKLIATESVFSMDGDLAPLPAIASLADRFGAALLVDESHATLVFGARGGGLAEHADVRVGTLSKAIGALGGFVATSHQIKRFLFNRGRSYVFSTAAPLPVIAAARAAIAIGRSDPSLRERLWSHVHAFAEILGVRLASPIAPVVLGRPEPVMEAQRRLFAAGFHVIGVRPPTVPPGTSRLRVTLSAAHHSQEVRALGELIRALRLQSA